MDIVLRQLNDGDVPVLSVAGEVDLATAPQMRDALVRLAADHPGANVVIDLDGVTLLDSVGLGLLIGGLRRMRGTGGDVALVCTTPRLIELLALCRLDRVFEIHPSVAAATGVINRG
jgi:anti-sigma B factor antagonist